MAIYLTQIFLVAFVVSFVFTPVLRRILGKLDVYDAPHERKMHKSPVVTMGGIAIIISICAGALFAFWGDKILFFSYSRQMIGLILGGALIIIMGVLDDLIDLHYSIKLGFQLVVSIILIVYGYRIDLLTNPFGAPVQLGYFSIPITILWLIFMFNIINIIDGIDGLAVGTCVIAAVTLAIAGVFKNMNIGPVFFISIAGACAGFLRYNYHPASIFMGNTGAYFIGYIFASISIIQSFKSTAAVVLLLPIFALGFPIVETILTIFRRSRKRVKIFKADTGHLHHIFMRFGLPPKVIVWIFYVFSFILGTMAIGFITGDRKLMLVFAFFILFGFSFLLHLIIKMISEKKDSK
ncbi:undecaprenyl/decaprenyl-phosphate alpha-N-acetylglucosaminyl 1-phosphate transferase [bacterium]|nr:undecaprenyl/decaprenyl-phosphate alpha-N-acetylglucosaminyl 1-phosphate transferase [bacterium]